MKYPNMVEATFVRRPNRFIAEVLLDGRVEVVHVKNTGRCRHLIRWLLSSFLPRDFLL